jgi:hypothetical protein
MKSPREILFEHHKNAGAKLDRIRAEVLAHVPVQQAGAQRVRPITLIRLIWLELILPARAIWTGFAVAWLFIIAVDRAQADRFPNRGPAAKASAAAIAQDWENQRILTELIGRPEDKPKTAQPQPRSESRKGSLCA